MASSRASKNHETRPQARLSKCTLIYQKSCTKLLDTETKSLRLAKNRAGPVSVDDDATLTQ